MEFHGYQFQINQMFLKPQVFLIIHQHTFDVEFEIQSTVIASYFILLQYLISISKDINETEKPLQFTTLIVVILLLIFDFKIA